MRLESLSRLSRLLLGGEAGPGGRAKWGGGWGMDGCGWWNGAFVFVGGWVVVWG